MPIDEPTSPRRVPFAAWLLVAAVAVSVQVLFVAETARELAFQIPTVDSATYHAQALAIAHGKPPPHVPFWQPPLYPYALATLYALGITSMSAVRLVHGLTAVVTALLTLCVARRVVSPRLAVAAGLASALYGPLVFYATQLLPTGLATATGMLALLAFLRLHESPGPRRAAACGAAFGLAAVAVPNILACAILPVAMLVRRRAWRPLAALVAGAALLILPVTLRNRVVGGEWVLISTNGGINLYVGNNEDITQTLTARPGQDWDRLTQLPYNHAARTPAEAQRFFLREVASYAFTSPLAFLRGLLVKAWVLFDSAEIPRNLSLYVFRPYSWMLSALVWRWPWFAFPFGLVGPLALLGAAVAFRGAVPTRTLIAHVSLYALTLVLFFPAARYRLPLIPPLLILATLGAQRLCTGRRAVAIPLFLAALLLCNWPRSVATDFINFAAELHKNLGVGLQVRGRMDAALREYDAALAEDPGYADAHYFRGTLLRAEKRPAEARAAFQAAIAARPNHAKALNDLGVMEFNAGRVELADALLRRALATDVRNARTMENLALAALKLGHADEARQLLNRAKLARAAMPEAGP